MAILNDILDMMKNKFIYSLFIAPLILSSATINAETINTKEELNNNPIIVTKAEINEKIEYIANETAVKIVTKEELAQKALEQELINNKNSSKTTITELKSISEDDKNSFINQINSAKDLKEIETILNSAKDLNTTKETELNNTASTKEDTKNEKQQNEVIVQNTSTNYAPKDVLEAFNRITKELNLSDTEINGWKFIIEKESSWNPLDVNPTSGAYGLGQAYPADKMAVYGSDYLTNPYTQLRWMYSYMIERYHSIPEAVSFWIAHNWY